MGTRGPSPTPTEVLNARGSWRGKVRQGEPRPKTGRPSCPAWLSPEAKAEWRRQCKELEALGLLARIDRAALTLYCEAWAEWVLLTSRIAALAELDTETGYCLAISSGLLGVKAKAADRVLKLAREFGFTPSARARLAVSPAPPPPSNKSRFFAGDN